MEHMSRQLQVAALASVLAMAAFALTGTLQHGPEQQNGASAFADAPLASGPITALNLLAD